MADVPAYYEHIKAKQDKFEFVKDAIKAYQDIIGGKVDDTDTKKKQKKGLAKGVKQRVCY